MKEKQIIEETRSLVASSEVITKDLLRMVMRWEDYEHYREYKNCIECLNIIEKLKGLLGLKEDEVQEGTNVKNYKLF